MRAGRSARAHITAESVETSPEAIPLAILGRSAARLRWGAASPPIPASAIDDADRTSNWRLVRLCFARIAIAIAGTLVESRRRLPAQFDSAPKVLRQPDESMAMPGFHSGGMLATPGNLSSHDAAR
jgi:hypothetical protein